MRLTTEQFIEKAKGKHGDKYDYSLVDYKNNEIKITIICKNKHCFHQKPKSHLTGSGCPHCAGCGIIDLEEFINRAREKHGNKYDYSFVDYKKSQSKVIIICKEHGQFIQTPNSHLVRSGCPKCAGVGKINWNEFIDRAKEKHGELYDYSLVNFKLITDKIEIICKKHNKFIQIAHAHLRGNGCPICSNSKLERKVLSEFEEIYPEISIEQFYKPKWLGRQHLDFCLPNYKIGIECQGVQHYRSVDIFGGEKNFVKQKINDEKKRKLCIENNFHLIEIPYFFSNTQIRKKLLSIKYIIDATE